MLLRDQKQERKNLRQTNEFYTNLIGQTFGGLTIRESLPPKNGCKRFKVFCSACKKERKRRLITILKNKPHCGCVTIQAYTRKYFWDQIDWTQNDYIIANTLGCSRERVRQKRQELFKPKIPKGETRRREVKQLIEPIKSAIGVLSLAKLTNLLGTTSRTAHQVLKEMDLDWSAAHTSTKIPDDANWDLPNVTLSKIWDVFWNRPAIARRQRNKPRARWDLRLHKTVQDPEYQKAVTDEIEKAHQFHIKREEAERLIHEAGRTKRSDSSYSSSASSTNGELGVGGRDGAPVPAE